MPAVSGLGAALNAAEAELEPHGSTVFGLGAVGLAVNYLLSVCRRPCAAGFMIIIKQRLTHAFLVCCQIEWEFGLMRQAVQGARKAGASSRIIGVDLNPLLSKSSDFGNHPLQRPPPPPPHRFMDVFCEQQQQLVSHINALVKRL